MRSSVRSSGPAPGWEWAWLLWVPFVPVYLALTVIDWRTRLLPTYVIRPTLRVLVALRAASAGP